MSHVLIVPISDLKKSLRPHIGAGYNEGTEPQLDFFIITQSFDRASVKLPQPGSTGGNQFISPKAAFSEIAASDKRQKANRPLGISPCAKGKTNIASLFSYRKT